MTVKQRIAKLVDELPEDCTIEDMRYRLYVLERVSQGIAEIDAGEGMSEDDVRKKLSKWLDD